MVDIVEAVVGTFFLTPVVFAAIVLCHLPADPVLAMAAVLALPLGWMMLTFERFIFTFKGRYELYPALEFIRNLCKVDKTKTNAFKIDLEGVIPENKKKILVSSLTLTEKDFDLLFDPYRSLKKSRVLFWKSYRRMQEESKVKLPYVENIEDLIFFEDTGLADFIRSAIANYHTYLAATYAFFLGLLFSVGFTLSVRPTILNEVFLILSEIKFSEILLIQLTSGFFCLLIFCILFWATIKQSRLRRNEAIAHEFLLMKLRLTKKK